MWFKIGKDDPSRAGSRALKFSQNMQRSCEKQCKKNLKVLQWKNQFAMPRKGGWQILQTHWHDQMFKQVYVVRGKSNIFA
jgi:hypothetical protein